MKAKIKMICFGDLQLIQHAFQDLNIKTYNFFLNLRYFFTIVKHQMSQTSFLNQLE